MDKKIKTAKFLARLLDNQFELGGVKFGIDPILDIVPWVGTVVGSLLSLYILKIGKDLQVSKIDMLKMVGNIIIDFLTGLIPLLGIIFDVFFKANIRNLKILEKYSHGKFVEGEIIK